MTHPHVGAEARRHATRLHRGLADDLTRLRTDSGVSKAALATAAGVDLSFLCRIEDGTERPSLETYARLAAALGADLAARIYPNTGPRIRDRHQALIAEAVLRMLGGRWTPHVEVAVRRPARGWIDLVLHDRGGSLLLRWSAEKAASLPSWDGWTERDGAPAVSRLLIVRSTRATRAVAQEFRRVLATAYPARPDDALAALAGTDPWPGPALLWARAGPAGLRISGR